MKYYIQKLYLLPLLGFLTAGCSTSSNLQTSEADDVYFSSSDKVTLAEAPYNPRVEEVYASENNYSEDIEDRVSDPETYANNDRRGNNTPFQYSYYDAPFGNPFYGYQDPFYFPGRFYSRGMMMSPWMDPWYDPFFGPTVGMGMMYDPFWPRYGSGIAINIGMGWGRAYNPWGYGYGMYNPYRYGGYYGGGMYDGFSRGVVVASRPVQYAPRTDRSSNTGTRSNPNLSRTNSRNSIVEPAGRMSRSSNSQNGQINRTRSSSAQTYPDSPEPRRRTREVGTNPNNSRQNTTYPSQSRSREVRTAPPVRSSGSSTPPTRRRNESPALTTQRSERRQDYTPAQPRSSYEPSRSSYEPTRSSSSGSSSGSSSSSSSGRRGRN